MAGVVHRAPVIGGLDSDARNQLRIEQTRANAGIDVLQREIGGHHDWQAVDITIIEDLKQFFLRPARRILSAKIVQDKDWRPSNLFKPAFEAHLLVLVREAQAVQKIWDRDE